MLGKGELAEIPCVLQHHLDAVKHMDAEASILAQQDRLNGRAELLVVFAVDPIDTAGIEVDLATDGFLCRLDRRIDGLFAGLLDDTGQRLHHPGVGKRDNRGGRYGVWRSRHHRPPWHHVIEIVDLGLADDLAIVLVDIDRDESLLRLARLGDIFVVCGWHQMMTNAESDCAILLAGFMDLLVDVVLGKIELLQYLARLHGHGAAHVIDHTVMVLSPCAVAKVIGAIAQRCLLQIGLDGQHRIAEAREIVVGFLCRPDEPRLAVVDGAAHDGRRHVEPFVDARFLFQLLGRIQLEPFPATWAQHGRERVAQVAAHQHRIGREQVIGNAGLVAKPVDRELGPFRIELIADLLP